MTHLTLPVSIDREGLCAMFTKLDFVQLRESIRDRDSSSELLPRPGVNHFNQQTIRGLKHNLIIVGGLVAKLGVMAWRAK